MKAKEMVQISRAEGTQLSPCHSWGHGLRRSGRSSRCPWNPPGTSPLSHVARITLCESTKPCSAKTTRTSHQGRLGAAVPRHRGDNCSIPSDSLRSEPAPRAVGTQCHPMSCLGISSPRHCGCHWPSQGQAANSVFVRLFPVICFLSIPFSQGRNSLWDNEGKTPGRCVQEEGISAGIMHTKNCVCATVW